MKLDTKVVKAVIFDFDGTIANSFEVFVRAIEVVLRRKPFTAFEIKELRQYSMPVVIKKWQLPMLVIKGRDEVDRHMDDVVVFKDIPEALAELSHEGYGLYIVSSHAPEGIQTFMDKYQLSQHKYKNIECVFVGDEVRDVQAAKKSGMKCIAVGWGFNTLDALNAHKPSCLVNKPADLPKSLETLSNAL
jgi:phosphoglycolate phosphatase